MDVPLDGVSAFQRDLLFNVLRIEDEDPNGIDIKDKLYDFYGEDINQGRLYQNLRRLDEKGLIDREDVDGRESAYHLSDSGRRFTRDYADWATDSF